MDMMFGELDEVEISDIMYENESDYEVDDGKILQKVSPADALVKSMNLYGEIHIPYMCSITGMAPEELTYSLEQDGAIFADPRDFCEGSPEKTGWILRGLYARGNICDLLRQAKVANSRYKGRFRHNIEYLKERMPATAEGNGVYVAFGANWVPVEYYISFLKELLDMSDEPIVRFHQYTGKWIVKSESANPTLDKITYGTNRMNAVKICEHCMNAIPIRVTDPIRSPDGTATDYKLNEAETMAAEEKARLIMKMFQEYVRDNPKRRKRLAEIYMTRFGFGSGTFDGSWLELSDLSPEVSLYRHQRDALARILLCPNTLLSHEVGTGKTFILCMAAHELYRTGLSKKNLVVAPNNVLGEMIAAHYLLFPQDRGRVLEIYPKDFTVKKRPDMLAKMKEGDYVAIYMAYSSFDMLCMSREWRLNQKLEQIKDAKKVLDQTGNPIEVLRMKSVVERLQKQYEKMKEELEDRDTACFDQMGITGLLVDEAHNYKNITIQANVGDIVGMHTKGSQKADSLMEKVRLVQKNDGRVVFSTGTCLVNSLADIYVMQLYLQPEVLEAGGVSRFNEWLQVYCEKDEEPVFEVDVDGGCRYRTRFSHFHNLPELMASLALCTDFHAADREEMKLPVFKGYEDIAVPRSSAQKAYMELLVERTEEVRAHRVSRKEDNMLKITNDGKAVALDLRLVDRDADGDEVNKAVACARRAAEIYRKYPGTAQIIFCDISTPKPDWNMYDEVKMCLLKQGVKDSEIAYIHDAVTEKQRVEIMRKVNKAEIRIIIGSTMKLGVGSNVQEHLKALHYLSIPWRPADCLQREGRIIRQGNRCGEVFIFRYVCSESFDGYIYQILENKQKMIVSFQSGMLDADKRSEDGDISQTILDYATIKALAIGNPLVKERVRISNELEQLRMAYGRRNRELRELDRKMSILPEKIDERKRLMEDADADWAYYLKKKEVIPNDEREGFGEELAEALRENVMQEKDRLFEDYQGFRVVLPKYMTSDQPYLKLEGLRGIYHVKLKREDQSVMGYSRLIDYVLNHLKDTARRHVRKLEGLKAELLQAKEDAARGNPYDGLLIAKAQELEEIDRRLRMEGV